MKIYIYQIADRSIYIFFIYVSYRLVVTVLSNTPRASWKVKLTGTSPRRARNFASTICFLSRLFAQNLSGDDGHIRRARGSTRSLHPRRRPRATVRGIKQAAGRPANLTALHSDMMPMAPIFKGLNTICLSGAVAYHISYGFYLHTDGRRLSFGETFSNQT